MFTAVVLALAAVATGAYLLVWRSTSGGEAGSPVAGQLRGTYPDRPTVGWRLTAAAVFDRAAFVRPDSTSYQYLRPGFIDLGDTLITSAVLPQSDRGATLVAVDTASGAIRWTADAGFHPVCANATVNGLLPCLGQESRMGAPGAAPPPYVHFLRMSDGTVDRRLPVSEFVRAVEVDGSAVYTMGYDYETNTRSITRGTVDDLDATWAQRYHAGDGDGSCPGSGDSVYDGIDRGVVYSGNDGGMVVADPADGERLSPEEVTELSVFEGHGFTARLCGGSDPDAVNTAIVDEQGRPLRTVSGTPAVPWLVGPTADLPYIVGRTAHDFLTGREIWTATGGHGNADLHTVIGDTVIGGGRGDGPLAAFDLDTGEHLWTSDMSAADVALSDGRRVMVDTDAGMVSIDLATGEREWTLPGVGGGQGTGPVGDGFAHATEEAIAYYAPTGGPSVTPGRQDGTAPGDDESGGTVTRCGRTPELRPVSYRAENGALVVAMEVKARCPGGDIVSSDRLKVTIRDADGLICSAAFDFSQDPLIVGGDTSQPTVVELTFEGGSYVRHPNSLGDRSAGRGSDGVVTDASASGTEVVDCVDEGTSAGPQNTVDHGALTPRRAATSTDAGAPNCGGEADALAALRAQLIADEPFVRARLADRWVAQLSSKQPGLVAPDVDGRMVTWTPCEILQQHLRLRGQYPEVRLVWSDDWRTFDLAGWWVTIAGVTFPDPAAANGWCDARRIPVDECYAKVISDSRDSRGSTRYRR